MKSKYKKVELATIEEFDIFIKKHKKVILKLNINFCAKIKSNSNFSNKICIKAYNDFLVPLLII